MNTSDIERYFAVGLGATIQALSDNLKHPRYRSFIRGWQRGQYVMIDRPMLNQRYIDLPRTDPCAVRFLSEGVACGFQGQVLDLGPRSLVSHIYVAWPTEVSLIRVRSHERVKTAITCSVAVGRSRDKVHAEIRDVSEGGCALLLPSRLVVATKVRIWCTLPDGTAIDGVSALIRRIRATEEGFFHGCRFEAPEEGLHNDLQIFVADTLERLRSVDAPAYRVLVIDSHPEVAEAIRGQIEKKGYNVVASRGLVEGFYRLKVAYPSAVLINQEQEALSGVEICRLIRQAHGYHALPVIIYGTKEDLRAEAKAAGATGYVPTSVLIKQVAQLLQDTGPPA